MPDIILDEELATINDSKLLDALSLNNSTEALRDRDRKRDAVLLMKVANRLFNRGGTIEALAKARLSGEWEPDLNQGEVK